MNGKIFGSMLILTAALAGLAMWYLQVYGLYDEVDEITGAQSLVITTTNGDIRPLPVSDFHGIEKDGVPIGWRGCFTLDGAVDDAQPYPNPTPLIGPNWFRCYSARAITGDLETGAVRAVLSQHNIRPGIDRVIAIYPDGRAFGWHQLNDEAEEKRVIE